MRKTFVVVLAALALALSMAGVADAKAKKSYKVSLKSSVSTSSVGKIFTLSGKVSGPKAGGKKVKIQRQYVGGAWTTIGSVTTSPSGKYRFRTESARGGQTSYRAIKAKSSVRKAGVSNTRSLPVYKWLYLASESHVSFSANPIVHGIEQTLNGITYKRSVAWYAGDAIVNYKVNGLCTAYTTRAGYYGSGLPDDLLLKVVRRTASDPGLETSTVITSGTSTTLSGSLKGIKYLGFDYGSVNDSFVAALGDPRVYCNADYLPSFVIAELV